MLKMQKRKSGSQFSAYDPQCTRSTADISEEVQLNLQLTLGGPDSLRQHGSETITIVLSRAVKKFRSVQKSLAED